ncbi:MAG: hypothetical protein HY905_22585 [Deltaproteobacteria bacterium]|nr:hypothetical protein [Deltaproteobacteria bacterium]
MTTRCRRLRTAALAVLTAVAMSSAILGCEEEDRWGAFRQDCVDKINSYRATLGLAPYQRWASAESCADSEAASDGATGTAHGAFPSCGENAQNECPGWPSAQACIEGCLDMMWAEGPGEPFSEHGHFINMSSTGYTQVACGFAAVGGTVWAVQDFR